MDQQKSQSVSGQVNWNRDNNTVESKPAAANEARVKGPLTGKDVSDQVRSARSSSRRSRKSEGAFRTISEVADVLDVQQHVLRFWETKFSQIRPLKRGGGRRYYRPEDLALLTRIHHLLYTEGYTIKGVQKLLKEQGKKAVVEAATVAPANAQPKSDDAAKVQAKTVREGLSSSQRSLLESTLDELKSLRKMVASK
ncbi:MAG: MerR family transcriptional regulator [Alphaproteobacteria bacterium]|nr:MerR family transcriptional regulator [Alphaproteobacteria bacterium]